MNRWKFGDVTVTRIVENEMPMDLTWLLPQTTAETVKKETWLHGRYANEQGLLILGIQAFVIESGGMRIMVDTCVGNDKKRPQFPNFNEMHGPFLEDLAKAGYTRESIDRVICTHLHVDHVGWNTMLEGGKWVPTFPKARHLIGGKEWGFFSAIEDPHVRVYVEDSVRPVLDAGKVELVDADYRITDEVRLQPTPGHTPGHVSVRISSRGEEAIIMGDVMHHPIQCAHPQWNSTFDSDPEVALKTRLALCESCADKPITIFGTHFGTPPAGRIVRVGAAFRFES